MTVANLVTRISAADYARVLELLDGKLTPVRWLSLIARTRAERRRVPFDAVHIEGKGSTCTVRLVATVPESVKRFGGLSEAQWGRAVIREALAARTVPEDAMRQAPTGTTGLGSPHRPRPQPVPTLRPRPPLPGFSDHRVLVALERRLEADRKRSAGSRTS